MSNAAIATVPVVKPSVVTKAEVAKYERMWGEPEYHGHSPGARWVEVFGEIAGPKPGETLIDLGCGAGEALEGLQSLGLDVAQMDLVDVRREAVLAFRAAPLWSQWSFPGRFARADFGYCCDVMEHIPPEYTMLVLERIRGNCQSVFFSIAHLQDSCGGLIDETLHLTLRPFEWWRDHLADIGEVLHGRDMQGESLFYVRCW